LLHVWSIPPGTRGDGTFSGEKLKEWVNTVKNICGKSGHLEVALIHLGHVLIHCPSDPDGLWIHKSAAEVLNDKDSDDIRQGFHTGIYNSRDAHFVDPTGKPEKEFAAQYREKAKALEEHMYYRFAATLNSLADSYEHDAERIASRDRFDD
jgi:hypothetical protein